MAFKPQAGKVLDTDDVADMLAYDEAGVRRPDEYADVVFDATSAKGAVYRVKTKEEKDAADEAYARDQEAAQRQAARVAKIRADNPAGSGAGVRVPVADAGATVGADGGAGAGDAPHTGEKAGDGNRARSR